MTVLLRTTVVIALLAAGGADRLVFAQGRSAPARPSPPATPRAGSIGTTPPPAGRIGTTTPPAGHIGSSPPTPPFSTSAPRVPPSRSVIASTPSRREHR